MHRSPDLPETGEPQQQIDLRAIWFAIRRSRWLVLGVTGVFVALALLITLRSTPTYEADSLVRIHEPSSGANLLANLGPLAGAGMRAGAIETEMLVLRSRQIAETVADQLALHVGLDEPSGSRADIFTHVSASREARPGVVEFRRQDDGSYLVERSAGRSTERLGHVRAGEVLRTDDLELRIASGAPSRVRLEIRPFHMALRDLRRDLYVSRPQRDAQIIRIEFRSPDPVLAAAVPNTAAEAFIRHKALSSRSEARSTVEFLSEQVMAYEGQLVDVEGRVRDFRESAQVVSPREQATEQVRRLVDLQARRDELNAERESLSALLSRMPPPPYTGPSPSPYRQLAAYPVFLANPAVQDILRSLTTLENQRGEQLIRRTEVHRDVEGINERIAQLEAQLYLTAQNYLASIENNLRSLDNTLARFGSELERIPAREVEFARLTRQQSLSEEIYTLLQTRLKEAEIAAAVEPTDVTVIDPALVPRRPVSPRPLVNLTVGTMLGLLFGLGLVYAREATDSRIRTPDDATRSAAGLVIMGTIPRIHASDVAGKNGGPHRNGSGAGKRKRLLRFAHDAGEQRHPLITFRQPRSPVSEAYRALRTNLAFSSTEGTPRVVVITSANPGDGKSTSAANLAMTLSQQGNSTLLVDADLRKGVLYKVMETAKEPGLSNVLHGGTTLDEALHEVDAGEGSPPLHFLSSGLFPPNPAELLGSRRMEEMVKELRERFDCVIFDAPPLNRVTDAALLARFADTTLLVVRSGVTERPALRHAAIQLNAIGAHVGGIVLNDFSAEAATYVGYGSYGYGE